MRPKSPHDRRARNRTGRVRRPNLDRLESRELLASGQLAPNLPGKHYPAPDVQPFVSILYPTGTPQPTAAEIERESFDFRGVGHYTIGPGGFSDQSITIHGYGKPGTSNLSRRFYFQFLVTEPTPTASSQVDYGAVNFVSGDYLQNSADLILDLVGPSGSGSGSLPTHLYWVPDVNQSSSGPFAETGTVFPAHDNFPANYFNAQGVPVSPLSQGLPPTSVNNWDMGLGNATFKYVPSPHPAKGSLGSGEVILTMKGLMNYSGAQSQIDRNIN